MRKFLPFLCLLALGACGTPSHWEKAGGNAVDVANDRQACHEAARREASRYFTYSFGSPTWRSQRTDQLSTMLRESSDRSYAEARLRNFCMRSRGYELVPDTRAPANDSKTE